MSNLLLHPSFKRRDHRLPDPTPSVRRLRTAKENWSTDLSVIDQHHDGQSHRSADGTPPPGPAASDGRLAARRFMKKAAVVGRIQPVVGMVIVNSLVSSE